MLGLLPILPIAAAPPSDGLQYNPRGDDEQNKSNASIATHTRTIGIIHPPPDIRTIVDKTATFVAKNGPDFENRIIVSNAGNPIFNFLNASDPYHAYYQHRLSEFRVQHLNGCPQPPDSTTTEKASTDGNNAAEKTDPSAKFRPGRKVLDPPEAEKYTIRLFQGITGEELDIIKLTAQFVARNGKSFLTGLTSRENNNAQFQFLKPTHSMFSFFTSVVDAYSKVLMPPKGLTDKLKKSVSSMNSVLERCLHRLEWEQSQEQARQKAEDEIQEEKLRMSEIEWHDFVVVENIDFADNEDDEIPPPMSLDEVIRRSKMSAASREENNNDDMEEVRVISEENEPQLRIVKNWKRPREMSTRNPSKYVVSPITGEVIPVNEMSEHIRICLIDPKYKEQKERMFAKIKETRLAQDDEISRNIVGLARTRPDIFGTTEEEVSNAVKAEIEKKNHQTLPPPPGLAFTFPPVPPNAQYMPWINSTQMNYGQQPPPMGQPMVAPLPVSRGPPLPYVAPPPLPEEPEPKKQRLDDSLLVPEDQFLAQHPGAVRVAVSLQVDDENLKRKSPLEITVESLSETVGSLKEKIEREIHLSANKQKLSGKKAGFLKDNMSLAYYNVGAGEWLTLSLRERGGRKK